MPGRLRVRGRVAALALACSAATVAAAAQSTPILGGPSVPRIQQGYGQVRPARIFNGGDPTGLVYGIHWSSWGGAQAIGTGEGLYVGPHEDVAHGQRAVMTIVAFHLGTCRGRAAYDAIEWYSPAHGGTFSSGTYIDACTGAYFMNGSSSIGGSPPNPAGALAAVTAYWRDIGAGEFAKAYAAVDPETDNETQAQFVANERAEGIESVRFSGRVGSSSAATATATIDVTDLVVRSRQSGCQSWSGSYLVGQPDQLDVWQIERADIVAGPCPA